MTALIKLKEWENSITKINDCMDSLRKSVGCNPETPLFDSVYEALTRYTGVLAEQIGDKAEWLDYYWHECRLGKSPGLVRIDEKEFLLTSVEILLEIIKENSIDLEADNGEDVYSEV